MQGIIILASGVGRLAGRFDRLVRLVTLSCSVFTSGFISDQTGTEIPVSSMSLHAATGSSGCAECTALLLMTGIMILSEAMLMDLIF